MRLKESNQMILATTNTIGSPLKFPHLGNPHCALEVIAGEVLKLTATDNLHILDTETLSQPAGVDVVLEVDQQSDRVASVELTAPGRYVFKIETSDDVITDVPVLVCEAACLARIPEKQQSGGGDVNKRGVLRGLAQHAADFHGLASELSGRSLANYGA